MCVCARVCVAVVACGGGCLVVAVVCVCACVLVWRRACDGACVVAAVVVAACARMCALVLLWRCVAARVWRRVRGGGGGGGVCVRVCLYI